MGIQQMIMAAGGLDQYLVANSLRFNPDDSAYLSWTPSSAGNRETWTWSGWVKRSKLDATRRTLIRTNTTETHISFAETAQGNAEALMVYGVGAYLVSTPVYNDPSVWYHIVLAWDTTQATSTDRIKVYVNGVQITWSANGTYPSRYNDSGINAASAHGLGANSAGGELHDGYLADLHFVDGTALDASSFGETVDGSWVPIEYTHSTSDWHTVNDGTNWTSSAVSGVSGWTQALAQGFNGSLSNAAEGNTNGETATIALGQDITISAGGVGVYTWVTSGAPLVFKLKLDGVVKETINQGASGGQWYYSSSYAGDIDSITVARTGRAPEWGAISINGVVLVDGAADNSFHLKFDNTSDLGEDSSGNDNDWTANSFSTSAGAGNDVLADSPTAYNDGGNGVGNYATLNPLEKGSDTTLSDGNLKAVSTNGTGWESHCSTLSVSTGKWYFETECVAGSVFSIGIADASDDISDLYTTGLSPAYAYNYNGKKYSGNVTDGGTVASSFTAGDLIGCAFDLDAGTIRFYKNGVDEGEFYNNVTSNVTYKAAASTRNATVVVNFGQRAFDNLPTGYKALNSYNT